ncbi:MAG: aldo/keto reductase [Burkholderiales bacterium]|nr:aldo/keto reductase [Burkholderiales bacterium]
MKYAKLGKTDIEVSKICLGGMSYGNPSDKFFLWTLDQPKTTEIIKKGLDLGCNFIDTANVYSCGESEQFIGKALKDLGVPRDKVVLASKVYCNEGHLAKEAILREIDGTLQRLGTDYLDLYYIHRYDYATPIGETLETLNSLVKAGKVRALGASAMFGYQFHNMMEVAAKNGWTQFSAMQNHYNLLYREDERELIPICKQYGVSLVPYSPLAGGHLTHPKWLSDSPRSATDKAMQVKYDHAKDNDQLIVDRVAEVAQKRDVSMAQVAISWLFAKGVTAPIIGATKPVHLDNAASAVDFVLTDEEVAYLEEPYAPHKIVGALARDERALAPSEQKDFNK